MKKALVVLFIYSFFPSVFIGQVSYDTLITVARNFIQQRWNALYPSQPVDFIIADIYSSGYDSIPNYYVINLRPQGFIILANTYASVPVLAYSFTSTYDKNRYNPAFDWWMKHRSREIQLLKQQKHEPHRCWKQYMKSDANKVIKSVAPLIITQWDQGKYYNSMCPADPNGPDGHCVTGCVATAVSQLMYYHRWPTSGTNCHSYVHPQYGTIAACFDTCFYDYYEMTPVLTNYNHSAALLLYTTGISFDMLYGPYGSGVWNHSVANSMKAYFKFCPETRYIFRDSTTLNWDSLVRTNLDTRKPLYYAGWEDNTYTMGHAFVCDGYQDSGYYHFNWGWGGYADGYYYSDQLNPAGSNFNISQELIVDIYPDTLTHIYPSYCNNDTIIYNSGTIHTNNGGTKKYLANSDCSWLIEPMCGTTIQAQFYSFSLEQGDTVFVYDGENVSAPLLGVYTKINPPILANQSGTTVLKTSGNKMFVRFTSDTVMEDYGFHLFFKTQYCSVDTLTSPNGTISDGSGNCDYQNFTNCRWIIMPPNAQSLKLTFTSFDLASNNTGDFISIYKNSISTSNLIAQFNGLNVPTAPIYVPSGIAVVRFISNSSVTSAGWDLQYEDATQISQPNYASDYVKVYPNPINMQTIVELSENVNKVDLYDITGRILVSKVVNNVNVLRFCEITPSLQKGVYILKVNNLSAPILNLTDF